MPRSQRRVTLAAGAAVGLAALAAFAPALDGAWLFWDDRMIVVDNPHLAFTAAGLRWMLTACYGGTYQPLAYLSFALDKLLWGLDPRVFHLTSLVLHALNAVLVYALGLAVLRRSRPEAREADVAGAAALGALLFALHPLRVESVAWISERREVLAAALYLGGVVAYLRAQDRPASGARRSWLAASAALVLASVFSKALAITAPLVLLVLDWRPLRRLPDDPRHWLRAPRSIWLEKLPFAAAAGAAAVAGFASQARANTVLSLAEYGWPARLAQAFYGLAFYARKTVWPSGLSPFYDAATHRSALEPCFVLSAAAVLAAAAFAWRRRRSQPAWLAAFAIYALLLAPVLGLTQCGFQLVADRYSYLACVGLALLAAYGWLCAASRPRARAAASAAAGAALLTLAFLTQRQLAVWRDSVSLWTRAAAEQPDSAFIRNNLGYALTQEGRLEEAASQFETAVASGRDCSDPGTRLGRLCAEAQANLAYTRRVQARLRP